ncbi:MAG: PIN domain-containing protein [Nitrososphaeria archaeon]
MASKEAAVEAGEFKGKYGIPIAGALIAASAYVEDAIFVSDDKDFRKISENKSFNRERGL